MAKWVFSGVITVIAIGWSFFWFKHPSYSGVAAPSDYVNSIYTAGGTMYSLGELIANPGKLLSILGNTLIHKFPVWVAQAVGCSL